MGSTATRLGDSSFDTTVAIEVLPLSSWFSTDCLDDDFNDEALAANANEDLGGEAGTLLWVAFDFDVAALFESSTFKACSLAMSEDGMRSNFVLTFVDSGLWTTDWPFFPPRPPLSQVSFF